ncbi:putative PEP-binding protein [Aliivibrio kagoshimensis]|uniref:putative PEP-binding protein n=1 Tax=Aliivibrio kagoshimensis TaxID=2910230 RepID=UPI003D0B49A0
MEYGIHSEFIEIGSLPEFGQSSSNSATLYVSLAGLIQEKVFYHPKAALEQDGLSELEKQTLETMVEHIGNPVEHFVSTLVSGIEDAITSQHTLVKVCLSDEDSFTFSALLGGKCESEERNPLLGVRGVSRFASEAYAECFVLECEVIKRLIANNSNLGVEVVVPFVRTLSDAATIIDRLAEQGLARGRNGLKINYVCDVPAAAMNSEKLLQYFDGLVINSDNLAQLILGVDKSNESLSYLYDPQNEAVIQLISQAARAACAVNKPVLLLSDDLVSYPKLQEQLIEAGVKNIVITS